MSDKPVPEILPPARAITQITAAAGDPNVLYALADDGTVWRLSVALNYTWAQLPALPVAGEPAGSSRPSFPV